MSDSKSAQSSFVYIALLKDMADLLNVHVPTNPNDQK